MPARVTDPPWLKRAYNDLGLQEVPGPKHSSRVLQMFKAAGHPEIKNDETAWCSAALNAWMVESGHKGTSNLMARSWLRWGRKLDTDNPLPRGAVLVFPRGSSPIQGHVCLLLEDKGDMLKVIGGNQSNAVTVAHYARSRLLGARWPIGTDYTPKALPKASPKNTYERTDTGPPEVPHLPPDVEPAPEPEAVSEGFWSKVKKWLFGAGALAGGGVGIGSFLPTTDSWQVALVICAFLFVSGLAAVAIYLRFFSREMD